MWVWEGRPGGQSTPGRAESEAAGEAGWQEASWGTAAKEGSGQAGNQTQECVPTRCFYGTGTIKKNSQTGPWGLGKPRKEKTWLQAAQGENITRRPECDPRDTRTGSHFTGSLRARWEPHTLPPQPGQKENLLC